LVLVCPADSLAANYAFDVTPARLVDYIVTERGVCTADERAVLLLFPEHSNGSGGGAGKARL
jgi:methylthioribose-1-phosphate isomerase